MIAYLQDLDAGSDPAFALFHQQHISLITHSF